MVPVHVKKYICTLQIGHSYPRFMVFQQSPMMTQVSHSCPAPPGLCRPAHTTTICSSEQSHKPRHSPSYIWAGEVRKSPVTYLPKAEKGLFTGFSSEHFHLTHFHEQRFHLTDLVFGLCAVFPKGQAQLMLHPQLQCPSMCQSWEIGDIGKCVNCISLEKSEHSVYKHSLNSSLNLWEFLFICLF